MSPCAEIVAQSLGRNRKTSAWPVARHKKKKEQSDASCILRISEIPILTDCFYGVRRFSLWSWIARAATGRMTGHRMSAFFAVYFAFDLLILIVAYSWAAVVYEFN